LANWFRDITPAMWRGLLDTGLWLSLCVHLGLSLAFRGADAADPSTGRVAYWPLAHRGRHAFVTSDQYWALAVTAGIAAACVLVMILTREHRAKSGFD
jgi:hypothetical protein